VLEGPKKDKIKEKPKENKKIDNKNNKVQDVQKG